MSLRTLDRRPLPSRRQCRRNHSSAWDARASAGRAPTKFAPVLAALTALSALIGAPAAHAFCVENHTQLALALNQTAGGASTLPGQTRYLDVEGGTLNNSQFTPAKTCVDADDKKWNPGKEKTGLIWFELWWYGQWEVGGSAVGASATSEAVVACAESPMEAGGRLVLKYDGVLLQPGVSPKKSKFRCERYDTDGTRRTDTGRVTASWSSNHSCEKKFPATKKWTKGFRHGLTESCYSCPKGYTRTLASIDGGKACAKGGFIGIKADHEPVKRRGSWGCKKEAFKHGILDHCYTCPAGFEERIGGIIGPDLTKVRVCYPEDYPET